MDFQKEEHKFKEKIECEGIAFHMKETKIGNHHPSIIIENYSFERTPKEYQYLSELLCYVCAFIKLLFAILYM